MGNSKSTQTKDFNDQKSSILNSDIKELVSACSHCGKCTTRCSVLSNPTLDVGEIQEKINELASLDSELLKEAITNLLNENYELYHALRQCCFCGYCTADCKNGIKAPDTMRHWRKWFLDTGILRADDSKLVMVDNEWNIFSAYRAIYEIAYPEFTSLSQAAEQGPGKVDTLFFPGCSLASYAPELVRAVGNCLDSNNFKWAISIDCCGSPLMSAGLFDRAESFRALLVEQMNRAGIKKLVTVCPGCAEELALNLSEDIEVIPLPELLLNIAEQRTQNGLNAGFAVSDISSVTFFDSCHDREELKNATALREIFSKYYPDVKQIEMAHSKDQSLCCGAGGAVSAYDPEISDKRVLRIINEAKDTQADVLVTMCPTCSYTIAQAILSGKNDGVCSKHYLEILFGKDIDWQLVFYQLGAMWSGEYSAWLNETFF